MSRSKMLDWNVLYRCPSHETSLDERNIHLVNDLSNGIIGGTSQAVKKLMYAGRRIF